jgi:hypothetical protein
MKNHLLFLIRLRSHWRRRALNHGFAAHRQAGQRAFRLNIQWCDSPKFEVEIAPGHIRSEPGQLQRERCAFVPLILMALLPKSIRSD